MNANMTGTITFIGLILLVSFCCIASDAGKTDEAQNDGKRKEISEAASGEGENQAETAIAEAKIGTEEGKISSNGLPLNIEIEFDEKSFDKEGSMSVYSVKKDIGIPSYEALSPIWAVKCDSKFIKKVKYTFQFDKAACRIDSKIVVMTWWENNWILCGIPQVSLENGTAAIEASYGGWFAVVRLKSRDEIKMSKYTFPDGEKRGLMIVGCFDYETKCQKGEDLLEEKLSFIEHFSGDVTFGPIEGKKRTGVTIFYAGAIGNPLIQSFKGKVTAGEKRETLFATESSVPKQRGVISGQLKDGKLRFDGMPTIITLTGLYNNKKVPLPTFRGDLNLSGISFDWKLQELFHLRNFTYATELKMPHGTGDEQTNLVVYLQFIVR